MATANRIERLRSVIARRQSGLVVVLEDVHDPHNAAAVMRSCDAFGVQEIHLIAAREPAFNPRRVGKVSSSSANKWLTFHRHSSIAACIEYLHDKGYVTVATALANDATSLFTVDFTKYQQLALVFGNEHAGISDECARLCKQIITLPMRGIVESLNISVMAGICLFEVSRQRLAHATMEPLSMTDQQALFDDFIQR